MGRWMSTARDSVDCSRSMRRGNSFEFISARAFTVDASDIAGVSAFSSVVRDAFEHELAE